MDIEIRPIEGDEFEEFIGVLSTAFGEDVSGADVDAERSVSELDRTLAAVDGDAFVGGATACTFELTVPGAVLPTAGVTGMAVLPTHRRRGVASAVMRRQMDDLRERGDPVAVLWASESVIYPRFGYGMGTLRTRFEIERRHTALAVDVPDPGTMTIVDRDEALKAMPEVYEAVRPGQPGMLDRSPAWWEYIFRDEESERRGFGAYVYALHEGPDGLDGYVAYRIKQPHDAELAEGTLEVIELVHASTEAYASMWRYLLGIDLVRVWRGHLRPVDEPLFHMLAEARGLKRWILDGMWCRLVDVPAALAGRRYAEEGSLVLEVRDGFCPWNDGRYRLDGGPDGATCSPTRKRPDLVLTANDLGAAYLGGVSLRTLARAGRVEEEADGGLAWADAMFGWDPAPWCPNIF